MASITPVFIPLIFFWAIAIAVFTLIAKTAKQKTQTTTTTNNNKNTYQQQKKYATQSRYQQQYIPQFSQQMEIDLRLPYRRFKQIYPHNTITYDEYKKIQVQNAFKRSHSSQKNHRMVR